MVELELQTGGMKAVELRSRILDVLQKLPHDSVVKIKIPGRVEHETLEVLKAASLRSIAPPTMNVSIKIMNCQFKNPHK